MQHSAGVAEPPTAIGNDDPLFAPLVSGKSFVLGRIAQSLDGYIATRAGESVWISGPDDLRHTHRLRALSDAVVVGATTIRMDNPRLTTRLVDGPSPVRVILDPDGRLEDHYRVFQDGPETLLIQGHANENTEHSASGQRGAAHILNVPRTDNGLDLTAVLALLRGRGLRRIFVEGGGVTVCRFLAAGALDRLHVTVAPLIMGGGVPAFPLTPIARLADGHRFTWTAHQIGADILLDIPLMRAA